MAVSPVHAIAAYQPVQHVHPVQPVKRSENKGDSAPVKHDESAPTPHNHKTKHRVDIRV